MAAADLATGISPAADRGGAASDVVVLRMGTGGRHAATAGMAAAQCIAEEGGRAAVKRAAVKRAVVAVIAAPADVASLMVALAIADLVVGVKAVGDGADPPVDLASGAVAGGMASQPAAASVAASAAGLAASARIMADSAPGGSRECRRLVATPRTAAVVAALIVAAAIEMKADEGKLAVAARLIAPRARGHPPDAAAGSPILADRAAADRA